MNDWLNPASSGYYIISGLMIFFFSYFWVATMFQPSQIAVSYTHLDVYKRQG